MIRAYNESYLDEAMENMGAMFDYAATDCHYDLDEFFGWFITSGIAELFGNGNPRYVAGLSGIELAQEVVRKTTQKEVNRTATQNEDRSVAYWAGWSMAYYQWYKGISFESMQSAGLLPSRVKEMYILHEADVSKFVEEADKIVIEAQKNERARLCVIRKARGFTQQQLADASGVKLRMIQLYEQKQNDINHASAVTVQRLARALGCESKQLLEIDL